MRIATRRRAPWDTLDYQRIVSARHRAGVLIVGFADGAVVELGVASFRDRTGMREWARVTHTEDEIVVPREADEDDEIPWDVIRSLTDPAFERHLMDFAAESAKRIGWRVSELRRERRLGRRELAERAGISPDRLAQVEAGSTDVSLPTLERIVAALDLDMDVFVVAHEEAPGR